VHGSDELEAEGQLRGRRASMPKLRELLAREKTILAQSRELAALRSEVETLRAQNERMKTAMRRCITCDFRLEVVGRG